MANVATAKAHKWAASLATTLGILGLMVLTLRTKDHKNEDDDDDGGFDQTEAFPWEPRHQPRHTFREQRDVPNQQQYYGQDPQKELEFLSAMTFANGGLRAPNCLCCL
jgi:hypothetical protein